MQRKGIMETLLKRRIDGDQLRAYTGEFTAGFLTHAADPGVRRKAASGGTVSALLTHLLQTSQIDGALVNQLTVEDNRARAHFSIATTTEAILHSRGSKYQAVHFAAEALPLIREFEGRLAVVALPCDARILASQRRKDPELDRKIALVITLFCGHNSEPELTDRVISRLNRTDDRLLQFQYRSGHWRGEMDLVFEDSTLTVPFSRFSNYQNLYYFCQRKCLYCEDHFGYYGDLSAGDVWSAGMKEQEIKHTALITRSRLAENLVRDAAGAGVLELQDFQVEEIFQGQIRTARCHYQVTARHRVGRLFGEKIPDTVHARVRLVDYLIAFIVLLNYRVSQTGPGKRLILSLPQPVLRLYLIFFKGLESI